jgi:hypothetical protein
MPRAILPFLTSLSLVDGIAGRKSNAPKCRALVAEAARPAAGAYSALAPPSHRCAGTAELLRRH